MTSVDDLAAQLDGSFVTATNPNSSLKQHPRFAQFKSHSDGASSQEIRRARFLDAQKQRRYNCINHVRRLADNEWDTDSDDDDSYDAGDNNETDQPLDLSVKPASTDSRCVHNADANAMDVEQAFKPGRHYENQLMLNEWMIEVPADLADQYLMVVCPLGKRSLVVASHGTTTAYSRTGRFVNQFPSAVPGGSRGAGRPGQSTVLDCVYSEQDRTYYILDVICWNGHPIADADTEFRQFWLKSKASEMPELAAVSKRNPFRFVVLDVYDSSVETIRSVLNQPLPYLVDGILFYHKRAHYLFGTTPLVLWIKPYMVPDLFGISVMESLLADQPSWYTGFESHLKMLGSVEERRRQRKQQREQKLTTGAGAAADAAVSAAVGAAVGEDALMDC